MKKFKLIKNISLLSTACASLAPAVVCSLSSCTTQEEISPKNVDGSNWLGVIDGKFTKDDYIVDHFSKTITYVDGSHIWTENLVIPNFVMYNRVVFKVQIGDHCFENTQYITGTVEFNDFANSVPNFCFNNSQFVTNLIMHTPPLLVGDYAFCNSNSFKGILIKYSSLLDDTWWINIMSIGMYAFKHTLISNTFFAPKTLTSIGCGAFEECFNLIDVNLNYATGLTAIEDLIFAYCFNLSRVSLPSSIISIGKQAFAGCSALTTVNLPTAKMSIELGTEAFLGDNHFISFSKPIKITKCDSHCFLGCSLFHQNLWNSTIDAQESWCGGMEEIGDACFAGTYFLSVKFLKYENGGPSNIGSLAFDGCENLSSIDMTDYDDPIPPAWTGHGIFYNIHQTGVIYVSPEILDENGNVPNEWKEKFMDWGITFDDETQPEHKYWTFVVQED